MSPPARICALLCLSLLTAAAHAHVASNGFLAVRVDGEVIAGSYEWAVRDAELAVGVDADHDGQVTWGELRAAEPRITSYLKEHLGLASRGGDCTLSIQPMQLNERVDGAYLWLPFSARCLYPVEEITVRYGVMDGIDPSHRGLLTLKGGEAVQTAVLGGKSAEAAFAVFAPSQWRAAVEYLHAGVRHILSGIDHLLFLLSLLLPAVLLRRDGRWEPVAQARPALLSILKVVTAFTLAHSITLTLAALDVVRLPSRLTESVIAASIIVAALNNIMPLVTDSRARIAFAFGLLHGFGFASVLSEMGLPHGARVISLLAFNLGIEAGQLAVVLTVMPVIYACRAGVFYRRGLMPWGSAAIALIAALWLVQRAIFPS